MSRNASICIAGDLGDLETSCRPRHSQFDSLCSVLWLSKRRQSLAECYSECENDVGEDVVPGRVRRIFCPDEYCKYIVIMLERHLCVHMLIAGYSAPKPEGIGEWAVKHMYMYCEEKNLPDSVWAYMYGN